MCVCVCVCERVKGIQKAYSQEIWAEKIYFKFQEKKEEKIHLLILTPGLFVSH